MSAPRPSRPHAALSRVSSLAGSPFTARWLWRLALTAFVLALLTLPIAWSVRFTAQSGWWWERGFDRFDAERRTGLSREEVDRGAAELRAYFVNDAQRADIVVTTRAGDAGPLFSEREIVHLIDVKRLLARTYDAGWASIGMIVAFVAGVVWWQRRRGRAAVLERLARAGVLAGALVVVGVGVLAVVAVAGFDEAFRQFHLLFFTNDLWQLSSRDRLIQMFPQGFFFETTLLIGATTIALAAAVAGAGYCYLRRYGAAGRRSRDAEEAIETTAEAGRGGPRPKKAG